MAHIGTIQPPPLNIRNFGRTIGSNRGTKKSKLERLKECILPYTFEIHEFVKANKNKPVPLLKDSDYTRIYIHARNEVLNALEESLREEWGNISINYDEYFHSHDYTILTPLGNKVYIKFIFPQFTYDNLWTGGFMQYRIS